MKLHDLKPNVGSKKDRKRVGRGISAGQGKTAGRGTKGAGARSGEGGHLYRQGGNLPFYRRLPFLRGEGFTPPNQVTFNEVNLDQLSEVFKAARRSAALPCGRQGCLDHAGQCVGWPYPGRRRALPGRREDAPAQAQDRGDPRHLDLVSKADADDLSSGPDGPQRLAALRQFHVRRLALPP